MEAVKTEICKWPLCPHLLGLKRDVLCFQRHDQVREHFSNQKLGEVAVLEEPGSASAAVVRAPRSEEAAVAEKILLPADLEKLLPLATKEPLGTIGA